MPPSKKRKVAATAIPDDTEATYTDPPPNAEESPDPQIPEEASHIAEASPKSDETTSQSPKESTPQPTTTDRQARFRALQARAKTSARHNLKEAAAESHRLATDPTLLSSLSRKQAIASHNLLKADTTASGEDFERKRAWDWTIEESERWDKRMAKNARHREDVAFQDYRQDARKIYKRQLRDMKPDVEHYAKEKAEAVQRAAANGGLEIIENEEGELVAIDKDGAFYSTADSTGFVENKPEKAAVDRLVKGIQKAEEVRMKKRRERGMEQEEGDVTYINDKNKQFNQKLARFYNKYTAEIRDSFERGTMI